MTLVIVPPFAEIAKSECGHRHAGPRDHRCPECHGTLRRCCASVTGFGHGEFCQAVLDRAAQKAGPAVEL